jgi:hypothetical protein
MGGGKKTISGSDIRVERAPFNPIGTHQQNSSIDTAVTLNVPNTNPAPTKMLIQATSQGSVRYTLDGSAPTPTFGLRLIAGLAPTLLTIGPDTLIRVVGEAAGAVIDYVWGQ